MQVRSRRPACVVGARLSTAPLPVAVVLALHAAAAVAQTAPAPQATDAVDLDRVQAKAAYRESLQQSLDAERYRVEQVDAIYAEDIGKFPDLNLAESMQRIAGVCIDREGGEGKQISMRGLDSDFTRVRIAGLDALATAGSGSDGVNRSRGFGVTPFASELFSHVTRSKTQPAQRDAGALGATVDLRGARPFDVDGFEAAASTPYGYNDLSREKDPRLSGLISNIWADGRLGALMSVSCSEHHLGEESYNPVRCEHGNDRNSNQSTATAGFQRAGERRAVSDAQAHPVRTDQDRGRGRCALFRHPAPARAGHQENRRPHPGNRQGRDPGRATGCVMMDTLGQPAESTSAGCQPRGRGLDRL